MQEVVEDRNLRAEMNFRALEIALQFQFVTKLTTLKPDEEEEEEEEQEDEENIEPGEGLGTKSASRYQKSNTGSVTLFYDHLALLSEAEFARTLPAPLSTRLNTASDNRFSFGDNDPHFVVQVSGMDMPFCFDIHGKHGQVLSLVRDENSGIIVNGLVTSAVGRPEATYFTELFLSLGKVNFTVTAHNITITFLQGHKNSKIPRVLRSVWPFKKMYKRGKKGQKDRKKPRRHGKRRTPRERRARAVNTTEDHLAMYSSRNLEIRRFQDSSSLQKHNAEPRRILRHGIRNDYNYKNRKRCGSAVTRNLDPAKSNRPLLSHISGPNPVRKSGRINRNLKRRRKRRLASERHRSTANQVINSRNRWSVRSRGSRNIRPPIANHRLTTQTRQQMPIRPTIPDSETSLNSIRKTPLKKRSQRKRRVRKSVKRRTKRNASLQKLLNTVHPHTRKGEQEGLTIRNRYVNQRHKSHPHLHAFHSGVIPSQGTYSHGRGGHGEIRALKKPVNPLAAASSHFQNIKEVRRGEIGMDTSRRFETLRPAVDTTSRRLVEHLQNASRNSLPATTVASILDKTTLPLGVLSSTSPYHPSLTANILNTGDLKRITHPQESRNLSVFHPHLILRQTEKRHPTDLPRTGVTHRSRVEPDSTTDYKGLNESRPNPLFRSTPKYIHPHSGVFSHTRDVSSSDRKPIYIPDDNGVTADYAAERVTLQESQKEVVVISDHLEHLPEEDRQRKPPKKTFSWRRAAGRRYGDVVVALKNRKKLEVLIGDVDIHLVITRSKTKYGQEFLGIYVEEHNILSPNTSGIIGQFAYKTVGTFSSTSEHPKDGVIDTGMKVAVLHQEANMQYRVSEVSGMVSKRRSMLHKSHVRCLLVPNQGEGLVAGSPEDYFLPCLTC